ncbi:IclR family transcriptional regulator [Streptomyces sp. NPDC057963]|uniref:IclR family transcriptional regulator n=1 Tax=Streptomyces sp. NPDC057963 TaxID=3346290 RepID=UPI0036E8C2C2
MTRLQAGLSPDSLAKALTTDNSTAGMAPSLLQAFSIIDVLTESRERLRLSDIVSRTGLPKTTAYRLLNTLSFLRVTDRNNDGYALGPALTRYANTGVPDHTDMIGLFYSLAGRIQEELGETVQLAVLTPPDVTFVAFVDSTHSVRLATRVGRRLPAYASAAGKALLAFSPASVTGEALSGPMTALTKSTITDRRTLTDQLGVVRQRGWASESEESARSLTCVAAPVLRQSGTAIAAITACLPVPKLSERRQAEIARHVVSFTHELSTRIGS